MSGYGVEPASGLAGTCMKPRGKCAFDEWNPIRAPQEPAYNPGKSVFSMGVYGVEPDSGSTGTRILRDKSWPVCGLVVFTPCLFYNTN